MTSAYLMSTSLPPLFYPQQPQLNASSLIDIKKAPIKLRIMPPSCHHERAWPSKKKHIAVKNAPFKLKIELAIPAIPIDILY